MKKMKKLIGVCLTLTMVLSIAAPTNVFAWKNNSNGDELTPENIIEKSDTGSIETEGTVGGVFDPTNPDPTQPNQPDEGHTDWVNVGIPTKMLFASADDDTRNIIAPKYSITNYSARGVEIWLVRFTYVGEENQDIPGTELTLLAESKQASKIRSAVTPLRTIDDEFRGGNSSIPISSSIRLATLESGATKGEDGKYFIDPDKRGIVEVQMYGKIGSNFDYPTQGENHKLKYQLQLNFHALHLNDPSLNY